MQAVLKDWRTAPVDPKLRAMLGLLETMTLRPEALDQAAVQQVRQAGVSAAAIRDAGYVCALFCTITRLADALDWDVPEDFSASRVSLVKFGYKMPPFL
ncbi:MAG: hypothetical protein EXR77_02835 [Myxococcales bacterium]|nr:hypothetical protein [Myxococcales bacterium]